MKNQENLEGIVSKLKEQGVKAGETEKKRLIDAANEKAEKIIAGAEAKSREIIDKAKSDAAQMEKNAKAAIVQASRDLVEATKISIINQLKSTFGQQTESLLTQEQYLQEVLKAVIEAIPGNKEVEIPAKLVSKMEAFLIKAKLSDGVEIKPLKQSEVKISVTSTEKGGITFVLTSKDIEDAMFSLINRDLVELITKSKEE